MSSDTMPKINFLSLLNDWFKNHYLLLAAVVSISTYISSSLVGAAEFELFKQNTTHSINVLNYKQRLSEIRRQINDLDQIPESEMPAALKLHHDRLKREEALLEKKINS